MKRDCEGCGKQWEVSTTQSAEQTYICPVGARHRRYGAERYPGCVTITHQDTWERFSGYGKQRAHMSKYGAVAR